MVKRVLIVIVIVIVIVIRMKGMMKVVGGCCEERTR